MRILTMKSCKRLIHLKCILLLLLSPAFSSLAQQRDLTLQKFPEFLNSVSELKIDSTKAMEVKSIEELIQGHFAGVNVTSADGAPGAGVNVSIRGTNFIKGSNQPLYILDGVILNPANLDAQQAYWNDNTDYQMLQNTLESINPMDIEKIEVLKDAASTSIYGSMGANGVILITTKQGSTKNTRVSWASSVGISTSSKSIDMLNKSQYSDYIKAKTGSGIGDGEEINWAANSLREALTQNHFFSLSGISADETRYNIAFGYRQQQGVVERTGDLNSDMRINIDKPIGKYGKVGSRTIISYNKIEMTTGVNTVDQTSEISQMTLAAPYRFSENHLDGTFLMESPASIIKDYDDNSFEYRVIPKVYAEAYPTNWLTLSTSFGIDYRDKKRQRWIGDGVEKGYENGGMIGRADVVGMRYNFDNSLLIKINHGGGKFTGMLGYSINGNSFYNKISEGSSLPEASHVLRAKGISAAEVFYTANYTNEGFTMYSGYTTLSYSYKDKYMISANLRADNNTEYGQDYIYYPSLSGSWILTNEDFLKQNKVLSLLKFRIGWGKSGIQQVSPYRYIDQFISSNSFSPNLEIDPVSRPSVAFGVNWHGIVAETNVGLDASFWKGRLNASLDVYYRESSEYLDIMYTDHATGISTREWRSTSVLDNKGIECAVDGVIIKGNVWKWNMGANIAFNRSLVKYADRESDNPFYGGSIGIMNGINTPATIFANGEAPGLFYGFKTQGIMQTRHEAYAPSFRGERLYAGDIKFIDTNNNGNVDDQDKVPIGNPNPKFTFGAQTSVDYKAFTLSASLYGSYGNDVLNLNLLNENNVGGSAITNIRKEAFQDAWIPSNTSTFYPAIGSPGTNEITDRIVEDGSFLRLSDISLLYQISVAKIKWVKALNVSMSVKNAFILTNYSGYDPEVDSYVNDISRFGCDYGSYPGARSLIFGVNATF